MKSPPNPARPSIFIKGWSVKTWPQSPLPAEGLEPWGRARGVALKALISFGGSRDCHDQIIIHPRRPCCYATGAVTGSDSVGGLIGYGSKANAASSYWNTQTSGLGVSAGTGAAGLTTAQMWRKENYPGWDSTAVWWFNGGYPKLRALTANTQNAVREWIAYE